MDIVSQPRQPHLTAMDIRHQPPQNQRRPMASLITRPRQLIVENGPIGTAMAPIGLLRPSRLQEILRRPPRPNGQIGRTAKTTMRTMTAMTSLTCSGHGVAAAEGAEAAQEKAGRIGKTSKTSRARRARRATGPTARIKGGGGRIGTRARRRRTMARRRDGKAKWVGEWGDM